MLLKLLPRKIDNYGVEVIDIDEAVKLISGAEDDEENTLLHHAVKLGCDRGMFKVSYRTWSEYRCKE
ncbi:hypothetical protein [Wolbachia endosymbiont of Chironomus riparius]|uniref:hypothetical protein n=1 Tax=Wolbachia endosymbiont of Chironomus riparius TaxID=2883238 RepID=UPI00209D84BD|nr:hypothetical protein [Wolbachia endosymbiont of Chironomus riparius]